MGFVLYSEGSWNLEIFDIKSQYDLRFGKVDANAIVGVALTGLLATTLLANLPQGILSFLYLTYYGLFTRVLEANGAV